jgi:hypothetical protein
MKRTLFIAALLPAALPVFAHRLDEYLQGTLISVSKQRIEVQLTLTPGVAVFPELIAQIDTDANGTLSDAEQHAYAQDVLRDLALAVDGRPLKPRLLSMQFAALEEMREGRGSIRLNFDARLPAGGAARKFTLENHHQSRIAAYQVNCLAPSDPDIRIVAQHRNYQQSSYELDFTDAGVHSAGSPPLVLAILLLAYPAWFWKRRTRSAQFVRVSTQPAK